MNKKQWYAWAYILIAAGVTLELFPMATMAYTGVWNYPVVGLIIGYICGIAGVACGICGRLEKEEHN